MDDWLKQQLDAVEQAASAWPTWKLAIHDASCATAATILILNDHPWWAAAFVVFMATTTTVRR